MSRSSPARLSRRELFELSAGLGLAGTLGMQSLAWAEPSALKISTFRAEVTPPEGHPLCGGWITPVKTVEDIQEALGVVITGAGAPIVICVVDWTGILNDAHIAWRKTLAEAVGTTPDRVAVQCVHQHDAPFVCTSARKLCDGVGANGTVVDWRGSSSKNPVHKELPDGLIDPFLKTVALYDGETRVAALHYYACHPMSHYGQGAVTSEYVGLARKRTQTADPNCQHMYFTGASGNIAAGKYNDGTPQARLDLTDRIYAAMQASLAGLMPTAVDSVGWQTVEILPQPRASFSSESLEKLIRDPSAGLANRIRPAMMLAWLNRCAEKKPVVLSALHLGNTSLLHLPAESFLEYQLRAQQAAPGRFVATAAYGDGGPWYIPVKEAYPQGGYEVSVAFSEPGIDDLLTSGVEKLARRD